MQIFAFASGRLTGADATYDDWLVTNSIPDGSAGPADRNGPLNLTNLEAYAYGLDPFAAVPSDLPRINAVDTVSGLSYFYRKNIDATDLLRELQGSTDLAAWAGVIPASESSVTLMPGVEGRTATITWGGSLPLFVRYEVSLIPAESTMVEVAPGTLAASGPFTEIVITQPFLISKYEATGAEWDEVVAWGLNNGYTDLDTPNNPSFPIGACNGNHPVTFLDWYQAVKFCNAKSEMEGFDPVYYIGAAVYRVGTATWPAKLDVISTVTNGYRLPTRAEWEYAARGGQSATIPNYPYSGGDVLDDIAIHPGNSFGAECPDDNGKGTWPVGSKAPNELGLYDMTGNVFEWTDTASDAGGKYSSTGISWLFGSGAINSFGSYQWVQFGNFLGFRVARYTLP